MELTKKAKASYGIGAVGKDMVYMLVSSYILYYYDSVLGLDPAFIGAVLMGARVFDAFNDPIMGIIIAKTKSRFGKFRPWILSGTVLNAVVLYAMFAVPDNMGTGKMKLYLTVIYLLWGITYTVMDIPYWSMIPAITQPGKERENISALARSCAGVGSAIPTVLTMIVVPMMSASSVIADYKIGFKYWALIIAVVFVIAEVICVMNVKEKTEVDMETHGIGEMFKSLFANDQALAVVVTIVLVNTALYITSNLVIYYFTYDVGNESAYAIFSGFGGASQILAMMLFPLFRKKNSKRGLFIKSVIYELTGYGMLLILTLAGLVDRSYGPLSGWVLLFVPGFLIFAGSGLLNVLITVFLSDSIDYGEFKNGQREESVIFSMQTFVVKLASGIAVFFAGCAIKWVGINKTEGAVQAKSTLVGLRLVMSVAPVALLILGLLFFLKKYILTEEKVDEISESLKAKRANL